MRQVKKVRKVNKVGEKKPFPTTGSFKYVPEKLKKFCVPVEKCKLLDDNPNKDKYDDSIQRLAKYIKQNGFRKPIVIDQDFIIRAGNHAYRAARLLGMTMIPAAQSDWFSEKEALRFVTTDNAAGELTEWDEDVLLKKMNEKLLAPEEAKEFGFEQKTLFDLQHFQDVKKKNKSNERTDGEDYCIFPEDKIIDLAFEYFRDKGFPRPQLTKFECMQEINKLASLNNALCLNSTLGYRAADTYHTHRHDHTAIEKRSPVDAFNDDKALRKALKLELKYSPNNLHYTLLSMLRIVNGVQSCSNFRPAFAKMIYNSYCKEGGTVFDPSMGYGGRLIGFLASHCKLYIGCDPCTETYEGNRNIEKELVKETDKKTELYKVPIEDFNPMYFGFHESADLCFTSPPYYSKEIYSTEKTQSRERYKTYKQWKDGFLSPMLKRCHLILKKGKYCIIDIEDVKIKNRIFPLVKDTIIRAKKLGFKFEKKEHFQLARRMGGHYSEEENEERAKEAVLFFKK
jgi:DNA modification methylase